MIVPKIGGPKWRFHVRGVARNLKELVKIVLRIPQPPPMEIVVPAEPKHPSLACPCGLGYGARHADHRIDCPWAMVMCLTCDGTGHCPSCMGDGTAPERPPTPEIHA